MATASDMCYEHVCSPCEGDRLNNEATKYYRDCNQTFCDRCVKQHDRILRSHTVLDRIAVDSWTAAKFDFPKDHVFSVKSERKVSVRVAGNKNTCLISDMCFVHDGRIMFVDNDNKCLKMLQREYNSVKELYLPEKGSPVCVCQIKPNEYAVCVRDKDKRKVLTFVMNEQNEIIITNTFLVNHSFIQFCHMNDRLYMSSETGLYVYSISGTLVNVLFKDICSNGCGGFAFCENGQKIIATHNKSSCVTSITDKGLRISRWKFEDLTHTPGVVILPGDAILVCGYNVNTGRIKISQCSSKAIGSEVSTGTLLERAYTDMWPVRMCYNRHTGELIVGGHGDNIRLLTLG